MTSSVYCGCKATNKNNNKQNKKSLKKIEKNNQQMTKSMKNYTACKERNVPLGPISCTNAYQAGFKLILQREMMYFS